VGRTEEKRPLGKPRRRWQNNIEVILKEVEWRGIDYIDLAQDRDRWQTLANAVMNLRFPLNAGYYLTR
jgi:hypothetical protein